MTLYGSLSQLTIPRRAVAPWKFTCTTTAAGQTLTLNRITPTGSNLIVYWGDGNNSTITNGYTGTTTHIYTNAGTYTVSFDKSEIITQIDLRDSKIGGNFNTNPLPVGLTYLILYNLSNFMWNVNNNPMPAGLTYIYFYKLSNFIWNVNTNPLPAGLTYLRFETLSGITWNINNNPVPAGLTSLGFISVSGLTWNVNNNPMPAGLTSLTFISTSGLTWNVNNNPMPAGLTYLNLQSVPGLTWNINASQPWPVGATGVVVVECPNVTVSAWTNNAVRTIRLENSYSQANVDAVINAIWANKANFTYATPSLDLLGTGNAAPSGIYQAASPPTTGNEKKYDLVNGNYTPAGPEWTVQTA